MAHLHPALPHLQEKLQVIPEDCATSVVVAGTTSMALCCQNDMGLSINVKFPLRTSS